MSHLSLKQLFHSTAVSADAVVADELTRRLRNPATLSWTYSIGQDQIFVVLTKDIVQLLETIWHRELTISQLWLNLPPDAQRQYTHNLLIEEILSSNEIEGVHSTRKELSEALESAQQLAAGSSNVHAKRFTEMMAAYLLLFDSADGTFPTTLAELRELYDQLLLDEINEADYPDGEYFRTGSVSISDGAKIVHKGVAAEEINTRMQIMLDSQREHSSLVAAAVDHFMLQHTHPFYDGNGRIGRFLLILRLRDLLSAPTALSLSAALLKGKTRYYKAFSDAEHPLNHAELTFFVHTMLNFLNQAQNDLLDALTEKTNLLAQLTKRVETLTPFSERQRTILFFLGQAALFNPGSRMSLDALAEKLGISKQTTRTEINQLAEANMVVELTKRPISLGLSTKTAQALGLKTPL